MLATSIFRILATAKNIIFPRRCSICHQRLSLGENSCCTVCFSHLPRTHFALTPYDNVMARMLWGKTWIEKAAALIYFSPASDTANLIYDLKYNNRTEIGLDLGKIIVGDSDFRDFFADIDAIVPMPIAKARRHQRGYNQCDYIAEGIFEELKIPVILDAVERISFKFSQTSKSHIDRIENVEGAFRLKNQSEISNKHILLIDDIMTTGSTISSCANEILRAENVKLSILTIGFTVQNTSHIL